MMLLADIKTMVWGAETVIIFGIVEMKTIALK